MILQVLSESVSFLCLFNFKFSIDFSMYLFYYRLSDYLFFVFLKGILYMKKMLKNKIYLSVLFSDLLSNFGDVLYYMALMNYVLVLPETNFALSIISLSETLPTFSRLFTGNWADRTVDKIGRIQLTLIFRVGIFLFLGFIMHFQPALWIVLVAAILNFFSDMAGQYENGLYIPISLRIIADEDRAEFMGFSQSAALTSSILFQSSGAILISLLSFSNLAFFNAVTFLISYLIMTSLKPQIQTLFIEKPVELPASPDAPHIKNIFSTMWKTLKTATDDIKQLPELRTGIIIIPFVNSFGAVLPILLTLMMSENKTTILISPATTLASYTIVMMIGSILGGFLTMTKLKDVSIQTILNLAIFFLCLMTLFLYIQNIYLIFIILFAIGILGGMINPKFQSLIYNSIPEERIATVNGGIVTYFQFGSLIMRFAMTGLVLFLSSKSISLLLLLLSLAFLSYTILSKMKTMRG